MIVFLTVLFGAIAIYLYLKCTIWCIKEYPYYRPLSLEFRLLFDDLMLNDSTPKEMKITYRISQITGVSTALLISIKIALSGNLVGYICVGASCIALIYLAVKLWKLNKPKP
jgi:hypothetical protein